MQKIAAICIQRPVFATMLIMSLVVVGLTGFFNLGVDRTPPVDIPTVYITTRLPGASPVEIENLVSRHIEESVNSVEGITELRSISGFGTSMVVVQFDLRRDVNRAVEDVRNRVQTAYDLLPRDIDPPAVTKFDSDRAPVLTLAVSGERSERELSELADKVIKVQLERSFGVGEVEIIGGLQRAVSIWIDPARLSAYGLPINVVKESIARQNVDIPGGNVEGDILEQSLRTSGRFKEVRDFENLVVTRIDGTPVTIADLGYVEDGTKEQRTLARLNGKPCVALSVKRQSDANAVEVIEGVKEKIYSLGDILPQDIKLEVIEDQSRYIYKALHEIELHLVLGSILACLVVFIFMRDWKAVLIAGVAIPASVISTFGMMWVMDFTLNSVTMLALVLVVGIVIDDAIVVLENIFRYIDEKKMDPFQAAKEATEEIGMAVMATTLSLVVIFVPVSFMSSISGRFLFQFGLTAAVAILVSLLVSFTLTPMMSARLLRNKTVSHTPEGNNEGRISAYTKLEAFYVRALKYAVSHRVLVSSAVVVIISSSFLIVRFVPQEFVPSNTDEGEFEITVRAAEGTNVNSMKEVAELVDGILLSMPEIRLVYSNIGGSRISGANYMRTYVRIAPFEERKFTFGRLFSLKPWEAFQGNYTQQDVQNKVRRALKGYPEIRVAVRAGASSINIGGASYELDFSLLGPDLESLAEYAEQLRLKSESLGIIDADTTLKLNKPELRVEINRERAADLGVDTEDIATALRIMVGGEERVSRFQDMEMGEEYDIQLRLAEGARNDSESISTLYVSSESGGMVRLDNLVDIVPAISASRIDRMDRQRQVSLRAGIAEGFALADRIEALNSAVREMNLPPMYSTRVSGRAREFQSTFVEFIIAFGMSILFMYMILASQYESLVHPLTILFSLPMTLPFALISLWVCGQTLNLYSALGLLVLFGVVKKNSILQIDHMNQLRAKGFSRDEAIIQGNKDRLRPILMTTLTFVVGMLPLALGSGPGAEERRAVAIVVIGGQSLSLFLTLIVTPVIYTLLEDAGLFIKNHRLFKKQSGNLIPADITSGNVQEADV